MPFETPMELLLHLERHFSEESISLTGLGEARAMDTPPGPTGTRTHARPAQPGSRVPGTLVSPPAQMVTSCPVTLALGSHGGQPSMRTQGLPHAPPPWRSAPHPAP